ncbi:SDR family oxidoreductase [Nocardia alba]|uniref:NAD(P)-dependent dehydrogenase (Short-subunit alcohol dehydrogenase family) n=1 Tax=Nocardia alba TaxID=225051 RepID=A0A4R1G0U6_9NOCA|nr:SDR family oxidoreductase [Nocardia alba]TCK01254.1 NAD(P)-dependent dehydrogenase (short-subunit alcohol dehydrogenase family) [Nocardia alba]
MAVEIDLSEQIVLVTGGVRGVGAGISRAFLAAGATVLTCARRPADEPITVGDRGTEHLTCDVRDVDAVPAMFAEIVARHGRIDHVVNNAGGAPYSMADATTPKFHAKIVELNLLAPLLISQQANALMQKQDEGGSIVMITSVSGHRPSPGTAAYGAAKAGLDSLVTSLAIEWAPKVRLNSVVVGPVKTELSHLHYGDADGVAAVARTVPLGRLAAPADVGNAALFLASPLAAHISGAALVVHGGGERPAFLDAANADN